MMWTIIICRFHHLINIDFLAKVQLQFICMKIVGCNNALKSCKRRIYLSSCNVFNFTDKIRIQILRCTTKYDDPKTPYLM